MYSVRIAPNFQGQTFKQFKLVETTNPNSPTTPPKRNVHKDHSGLVITGLVCAAAIGAAILSGRTPKNKIIPYNDELFTFKTLSLKLKQLGADSTTKITQNCTDENIVGMGATSKVFQFTDPSLENWVIKVDTKHNGLNNSASFILEEVEDEFAGANMGQEIGKIGPFIKILKKIDGVPHSLKDWAVHRATDAPITAEQAGDFIGSLRRIAEFPQESFDEFARRLKLLDEKGYKADSFNPNNYMIDYKSKQLYIIDAYKYDVDAHMNSRFDLIAPLLDYPNYEKYHSAMSPTQQKEFIQLSKTIAEKCTIGAKNAGVNPKESTFVEFLQRIDARENTANCYFQRYEKMKAICGSF